MSNFFGLRSRAAARGVVHSDALTPAPKVGAVATPEDDKNQPAASDDEYERDENGDVKKDENGNPVKKAPVASTDEDEAPAAKVVPPVAGLTGNARIKAILAHPATAAQRPLAEHLALETELDAVACSEILDKVTAVSAPAAPKASGEKPTFLAAMEKTANPKVPAASGAAPAAGTDADAIATMQAVFKKMGLGK